MTVAVSTLIVGLSACGAPSAAEATAPAAGGPAGNTGRGGTSALAYVDLTAPHAPLDQMADRSGLADFVLAFVLSDGGTCGPSWGGLHPVDDPALLRQITALREAGGTVTVASGGASGDYLENACQDPAALAQAYGRALDVTGSNHLEVDIEQDIAVDKVIGALALLQRERRTEVTLTLQVEDAAIGLTDQAVTVLRAAARRGLDVTANAMVMNYDYTGDWSRAMTQAGDTVTGQLRQVWPDLDAAAVRHRLGLTFMIGRNDTGVVTTVADADALTRYAAASGVGSVAFWSINRDNGDCPTGGLRNDCSGISQEPYQFARALLGPL